MKQLEGKLVLVTGASRGIGVDVARAFAKRGSRLALAARTVDDLEKVRTDLAASGADAQAFELDVSDVRSIEELVDEVTERMGPVDVLVNNAGVEKVFDFEHMEQGEIEWIMQVNVIGLLQLTRAIVPSMIERGAGHIVNMASMAGMLPIPHNAVYSASKYAVVGASRSLRLELAEHGIGVSVICPGFVTAGMFASWGRKAPAAAGTVSAEQVARATLDSVIRNRPVVKVVPPLGRLGPTIDAVSPATTGRMMHRTGVARFLKDQAGRNASGDG